MVSTKLIISHLRREEGTILWHSQKPSSESFFASSSWIKLWKCKLVSNKPRWGNHWDFWLPWQVHVCLSVSTFPSVSVCPCLCLTLSPVSLSPSIFPVPSHYILYLEGSLTSPHLEGMLSGVAFCEVVEVLRFWIDGKSLGHWVVSSCQNYYTHRVDYEALISFFFLSHWHRVTIFTMKHIQDGLESLTLWLQINFFSL